MLRALASSAAIVALAATAAMAQERAPIFSSEERVNNVTVDVQVRDAQGVPIVGLPRSAFRLFEDDKEQLLTNFLAVEGGQVAGATDGDLVGQPAARQVLLFFDLYLMTPAEKRPILASLERTVSDGLPPGVVVGVISFDGRLRVHTPPTASRDKLVEALREVGRLDATGLERRITLGALVQRSPLRESWGEFSTRRMQTEEYWNEMRTMVGRVDSAFSAALEEFSGTDARKIAVLISPGFPPSDELPSYRTYDFWLDRPVEYRNVGLFGHAALVASELSVTLFTLDASGNQILSSDAATSRPGAFNDVANVGFWREADRKDTLIQAAKLTGGDSIFTRDGGAAFADIERITSSYYSLAFQPNHNGDGKEHAIRVELPGYPKASLVYRTKYVDRPFAVRDAERARAALLSGFEANPLGVVLVLDKPQGHVRLGARRMHVYRIPAELRIPYSKLVMLPRGDAAWGQVQITIVDVDETGNQSELAHQTVPIRIAADRLARARAQGYFAYRFTLVIEGGRQSVRVAVSDTLAHSTSTAIANLSL
jgi:VWFA-related protein